MRYAARVKADPAGSLVIDQKAEVEAQFGSEGRGRGTRRPRRA